VTFNGRTYPNENFYDAYSLRTFSHFLCIQALVLIQYMAMDSRNKAEDKKMAALFLTACIFKEVKENRYEMETV